MTIKKHVFFKAMFLLIPFLSAGQDIQLDSLKKRFPGEHALELRNIRVYTVILKDGKPSVSGETIAENIALTDKGVTQISVRSLYTGSLVKNTLIEAKTHSLTEKNKYKVFSATDIVQKTTPGENVFYDDQKTTEITFPAVTAGSYTFLNSSETYEDARLFGQFFFSNYLTTLESEVTVKVDKRIHLKYVEENFEGAGIHFSLTTKGKYDFYTWKASNLPGIRTAEKGPGIRWYAPHLIFYIASYESSTGTVAVLDSPKDLFAWYSGMIKSVNCVRSDYMKKVCDSLTRDCHSEFDKVKTLFYWVQDNIKYIAFEEGYGGYVPREAIQIYEKRYGDCKDLSSILTYMLRLSGIKSNLTWIGTRDLPYTYDAVPTPVTDNHMIAAYRDTTGKLWMLDGTGKNADISMYTSMIQGKQALIALDSTHFELYTVPVIPNEKNAVYDSIHVKVNGGGINGSGILKASGYPKIELDYLRVHTGKDEFRDYIKEFLLRGNNTFQINSSDLVHTESREQPTEIHFDFLVNNYVKSYGDETYFNFNLARNEMKYSIDKSRGKIPLILKHTLNETTCVELELAANTECTYIPENTSFIRPDYGFTIDYYKRENSILMRKHFFCNKLTILPADFAPWMEFLNKLNKADNESIILKHKN
jgi:transglutaminase-like putative cysteine protease